MKIKDFFKKRKKLVIISGIVLVLLVIIIGRGIASKNAASTLDYVTVSRGKIAQEVSVTGKVSPAEAIDFAFETSGKVASVNVKVGDKIKAGKTLASLKNNDIAAQASQSAAGVDSARSAVNQY
jgi:multidrug efflux pump subunit AcrA (membrane-fusion protein)